MDGPVAHRKIELQSAEDLAYLLDNVRRAARERLDEAFPLAANGDETEDELRSQIEKLINEYISKTFTLAAPNIIVNGLPVDPYLFLTRPPGAPPYPAITETYEPFDEHAHTRVLSLAREEEDLLAEIAALKHKVPTAIAANLADSFKKTLADDDEEVRKVTEELVAKGKEGVAREVEGVKGEGPRQQEMEGRFEGVVGTLGKLTREMPVVVAKMERARVAGEYVVTQGR